MAYVCYNCGKSVVVGHLQRHGRGVAGKRWRTRAQVRPRTFKPNLQKVSVMIKGAKTGVVLCAKCLKRLKKDGRLAKIGASRVSSAALA